MDIHSRFRFKYFCKFRAKESIFAIGNNQLFFLLFQPNKNLIINSLKKPEPSFALKSANLSHKKSTRIGGLHTNSQPDMTPREGIFAFLFEETTPG
jgi:hypothetical protein